MRRLLRGLLLALTIIAGITTYLAIVGPETILTRDDNPRLVEAIAAIDRGDIYDRNLRLLVTSQPTGNGRERARTYLDPAIYGMIGYYSLRYGTGGAEAAYDVLLSGAAQPDTLDTYIDEEILHRPRQGSDVRLTIDLEIQQTLVDALSEAGCAVDADAFTEGRKGGCAGVVLSVPTGEVLALASLPTYDPNALDVEWDNLVESPAQPFFNRVLQGNYQPGTLSQVLLLTVALVQQVPPETVYDNASGVVRVGDVAQVCIDSPPSDTLSLEEAFLNGCPNPFDQLVNQLGLQTVSNRFSLFRLSDKLQLPGFIPNDVTPEETPLPEAVDGETPQFTRADAMGQGGTTVSPLQMASLTTAFINAGNAVHPTIFMASSPQGAGEWVVDPSTRPTIPVTTAETARRMQGLMRESVEGGVARAAQRDGYDIGGHVGMASSGENTQAWFSGWVRMASRDGAVVVILLENSDRLDLAAQIGGDVLVAAANARSTSTE
jgi:peptidoglycan glycosyltransferase